jgi:hypothetical protein
MTNSGRLVVIGTAIGLILLGSCATEPCACPPVLEGITVVAGNHQLGPVDQALADPIVVRADQLVPFEAGLAGRMVHFVPQPGSGSVSPSAVSSAADGLAQVVWTLGPDAGEDTLIVRLDSPDMTLGEAIVTATVQQ